MKNMQNIRQLRASIPSEVFEEQDFHLASREQSQAAQYSLLSRLLRKGDLIRISRGLYMFDELWRRKPISEFLVANKLVAPSYVSFESALSHHGLIPESVRIITSACTKRESKSFSTPLGGFYYHFVPENSFSLEIESVTTAAGPQLIATPLKALFDLVYARRKMYESLADVDDDLRIDPTELMRLAREMGILGLEELAESYKKKTCLALFTAIKKEMR